MSKYVNRPIGYFAYIYDRLSQASMPTHADGMSLDDSTSSNNHFVIASPY